MNQLDTITITDVLTVCEIGGTRISFKGTTTYANVTPQTLTYYINNADKSISVSDIANDSIHTFNVYGLPNGTYTIGLVDQEGNLAEYPNVVLNCTPQCSLVALTAAITPASNSTAPDGSLTLNNPSVNQVEYSSSANPSAWQASPTFSGLVAASYVITCREVNQPTCTNNQTFVVPANLKTGLFNVGTSEVIPVTNNALNNGSFKTYITNSNSDSRYRFSIRRFSTGDVVFEYTATGFDANDPNVVINLSDQQYNILVTETAPSGAQATKTATVTVPRQVAGCTNPKSSNYNAVANVDDGSCIVPTGNTGYLSYRDLEEYYLDDSSATGQVKPNAGYDPDYIPPIQNLGSCPL